MGPIDGACLELLFAPGSRPDADAVERALSAGLGVISHRPSADHSTGGRGVDWVEILRDGLTYDVLGLPPGPGLHRLDPQSRLGLDAGHLADAEAIGIAPGPHLAAAARVMPVVRTMFAIAAGLLSNSSGGLGALWRPARVAIAIDRLEPMIASWLSGGPFPAPAMIGFHSRYDGLASSGLGFFLDRELLVTRACGEGAEAMRLMLRLIDRFVDGAGAVSENELRLDDGSHILLQDVEGTILVRPG